MNPVRLLWWRMCDDARFGVRYICARWRHLGTFGVVGRWLLHLVAGNPLHTVAGAVIVVAPLRFRPALVVFALFAVVFEIWYQVQLSRRRASWLHGWRLWWRVRRSIPSEWNESAVKSERVKSPLGGEVRMSGLVRPVADHPKTSWWPQVEWPVVSVWCGHPPGRTPAAFVEFQRVLAANILRVDNVEFDFARDRDSVGRLQLTFVDVLSQPVESATSRVNLRLVRPNREDGQVA